MPRSIDLSAWRRFAETQTGLLSGFTTDHDRARFPCLVTLEGLCAEKLGYRTFCDALQRCVRVAVELAPLEFRHDAYYENHQRAGYHFIFARQTTAIKFMFHYQVAQANVSVKITGPRIETPGEAPAMPQGTL